jgi:hypothetical protein
MSYALLREARDQGFESVFLRREVRTNPRWVVGVQTSPPTPFAARDRENPPSGLGQGLQARGQIGRIAGDIVLDNLAADDNQPGGNPDPRVELFALTQLRHPIDQRQPAARGARSASSSCACG